MINARESIDREHTCIQAKISPRKTKDELTKYQNEQILMPNSLLNLDLLNLVGIYPPQQSFHIMGIQECGFRIELGFISWIADSLSCILDSKAQEFGLQKQKYPGFRNLLRGIQNPRPSWIACLHGAAQWQDIIHFDLFEFSPPVIVVLAALLTLVLAPLLCSYARACYLLGYCPFLLLLSDRWSR